MSIKFLWRYSYLCYCMFFSYVLWYSIEILLKDSGKKQWRKRKKGDTELSKSKSCWFHNKRNGILFFFQHEQWTRSTVPFSTYLYSTVIRMDKRMLCTRALPLLGKLTFFLRMVAFILDYVVKKINILFHFRKHIQQHIHSLCAWEYGYKWEAAKQQI